jgi:hypothetical protein
MSYDCFVGVFPVSIVPLFLLLVLRPEVLALDKSLFDVALLVIIVQFKESFERISRFVVLLAELMVVLPGVTVFETGALAIVAEHLYLLGIEAVLYQELKVVAAVAEVEMTTQMLALLILKRDIVEAAAVCSILHNPEILEFTITCMFPDDVSLNIVLTT